MLLMGRDICNNAPFCSAEDVQAEEQLTESDVFLTRKYLNVA